MKQEFEDSQFAKAARVAKRVTLRDVYAKSCDARLACARGDVFKASNPTTSYGHEATHVYSKEDGLLSVTVLLNLSAQDELEGVAPEDQKELLSVDVELVIEYDFDAAGAPESELDEHFEDFASVNGLYNAWPYLREIVSGATSRMGIPPCVLPVLHLVRSPKPEVAASLPQSNESSS